MGKPRNRRLLAVSDGLLGLALVETVGPIEASSDVRPDSVADQRAGAGSNSPARTLADVLARRQRATHGTGHRTQQFLGSRCSTCRVARAEKDDG